MIETIIVSLLAAGALFYVVHALRRETTGAAACSCADAGSCPHAKDSAESMECTMNEHNQGEKN